MFKALGERVALVAFPASAIVIIAVTVIRAALNYEVPEEAAAAATGLLTWLAFVSLGAGGKP